MGTPKQLLKSITSGLIVVIVELGFFWLLLRFNLVLIIAQVGSFTIATGLNFILHKKWVFSHLVPTRTHVLMGQFFLLALVGIFIETALLFGFSQLFKGYLIIAKLAAMSMLFIVNFLLRRWLFHRASS